MTDPYAIWVSEIMLQQTTVATVQARYEPFLQRFPSVEVLASASEADVLHAWQGLGYYRRARNLHLAARQVMTEHGGTIPSHADQLMGLPGLGRYTANAILSFAFNQPVPIIEANTRRLWGRLCASTETSSLDRLLWPLAEEAVPPKNAREFNNAVMDLGATVCVAGEPSCAVCPIRRFCIGLQTGTPAAFPLAEVKKEAETRDHAAVAVWWRNQLLAVQRPETGIWSNMWELPRVERQQGETWESAARRAIRLGTAGSVMLGNERNRIRHGIMHYRVTLVCFDAICMTDGDHPPPTETRARWLELDEWSSLPVSSPQRRLLAEIRRRPGASAGLFPGDGPPMD